jgi:hypothetical protein
LHIIYDARSHEHQTRKLIRRTKAVYESQGAEQRRKERKEVTERTIRTPEKEKKTINVHVKVTTQRTGARSKRNGKNRKKRSQGREARRNKESAVLSKYE